MKLGIETNSLSNWMMSGTRGQSSPTVGMGVTFLCWTDRHAGTIIEVSKSGKKIVVQRDHAKRTDSNGMSELQSYEFSRNPEAAREEFSLRKNGEWRKVRCGSRIALGHRSEYHDYSF